MSNKVTIIGAGNVGATIAYNFAVSGIANEICLVDIAKDKAEGEAMDIAQGTPYTSPVRIYSGEYSDAVGSQVVVITSGVGRKPGQTRLDLANINVGIVKSVAKEIVPYCPDAIYIIVSNPADINAYVFAKEAGVPVNHVIGTGTTIDTARLRDKLAQELEVSQDIIHAYVFGEHGDTSFVPWSICRVGAMTVDEYAERVCGKKLDHEAIEEHVRTSGAQVIARKKATFYAIAASVAEICEKIFSGNRYILPVATVMNGELGVKDVAVSLLALVSSEGVEKILEPDLTEEELEKFRKSAAAMKAFADGLGL